MNLFLLQYNNYYNRIAKKFDSIYDYGDYVINQSKRDNFNPGDGVNTKIIANYDGETQPDYAIVTDGAANIISRWFVIDAQFIRKGQYELTLHRDVIADNYDEIIDAPCFIEKATLEPNDPFILNHENMSFNQIKTSETLLKDRTNSAWIVGYFARTNGENFTTLTGTVDTVTEVDVAINGPLSSWKYAYLVGKTKNRLGSTREVKITYNIDEGDSGKHRDIIYNLNTNSVTVGAKQEYSQPYAYKYTTWSEPSADKLTNGIKAHKNDLLAEMEIAYGVDQQSTIDLMKSLNGLTISYIEGGKKYYKRVNITEALNHGGGRKLITHDYSGGNVRNVFNSTAASMGLSGDCNNSTTNYMKANLNSYTMQLADATKSTFSYNVDALRPHPVDAPYDIFVIPYGDVLVKNIKVSDGVTKNMVCDKQLMLNIATAMAEKHGKTIYDLQLLPYFPAQNIISGDGEIDLNALTDINGYYTIRNDQLEATDPNSVLGVIITPTKTSFSFDIPLAEPIEITDIKIQNECDMYRLCAPNFSSVFEFNAAKNGGVTKFNVDATYLPYNPYIHVNPNFGNLYGKDFDDARGLICNGDYSLTRLNDAWTNYQLNNKNYLNSFKNQVSHMETQNKYQLVGDIVGAIGGAGVGAGTGAMIGSMVGAAGGPAGMIAGGVLGGLASAGAGIADVILNEQLRNDAIDYTKDQFGYQLDNIKAMPDTIAKTTAFTLNNKYFPVLEYYTCKAEEKEALKKKIKYNGMTVMRIGTIKEFIKSEPSYIKGKLIRLENVGDDFHLVNTIAGELDKGIFI